MKDGRATEVRKVATDMREVLDRRVIDGGYINASNLRQFTDLTLELLDERERLLRFVRWAHGIAEAHNPPNQPRSTVMGSSAILTVAARVLAGEPAFGDG